MEFNFWGWTRKRLKKFENNIKQVELALYYWFDFRATKIAVVRDVRHLGKFTKKIGSVVSEKYKSLFYKEKIRNNISERNIFV